jgi:hypothetical protein
MIVVGLAGIAFAFLRYLVAFLDSPFLGPDPHNEAAIAPIRFAIRGSLCGGGAYLLIWLWKRLPARNPP